MGFRDLLAIALSAEQDRAAFSALEILARDYDARASVTLVEIQPDPAYTADGYVLSDAYMRILADAHEAFLAEKQRVSALAARASRPFALRTLVATTGISSGLAAVEARHADLTILTRPDHGDEARRAIFEGVLFGSGRPVLLTPPEAKLTVLGENIAIAWNASREAARALSDAAPLIDHAKTVTVMTVDAKPGFEGHGQAPGMDVTAHLARRGIKAQLSNIDGMGRSVEAALLDECRAIGADLLVLGGYGHARFQERIFGGVTRALCHNAPLPLFLSH